MRRIISAGALGLLLPLLGAASAQGATYGGSSFSGSLEGWQVPRHECKVPGAAELEGLCKNESGIDPANGNPAGSLAEEAKVLINPGGLLKAGSTFESPTFTVGDGGQGTLVLDRAFDPGGLAELNPRLTYTATLVDRTSSQSQQAISETVEGSQPFATRSGSVSLLAGHRYAVVIESEVNVSLAGVSLGASTARFDNVAVTGPGENGGGGGNGGDGANGGDGGNGAGGLSDSRLASLINSSMTGNATVKNGRIMVKARCPKKVGAACRIRLQGLLKKGKPATAPRTVKIPKGKSKTVALKIKPKLKGTVAKRKKLLFKETVRAAKAKATVYKTLKLIKR